MQTTVGKAAIWLLSCFLVALASQAAGAADDVTSTDTAQAAPAGAQPAPPPGGQPTPPTQAAQPAEGKPAEAPTTWLGSIKFSAQVEGGIIVNPDRPNNGLNFGQLFTDRANQVVVNQVLLGVQRPIDPKATDYDFGFQVQALYGTDARYVQFLGEMNYTFASRYQIAWIAANLQAHLPWLTPGGIDVKAGQYPTPLGFETIDPSTNPFYSHSYIFNFGLPFVHTGVLGIWHATPTVDIYGAVDSGTNTTLGGGDNNQAAAGLFGVGLTLLDGNLTVLGLTHFGPEDPTFLYRSLTPSANANGYWRWFNDLVVTYKASDKLSFTTEANLVREGGAPLTNPDGTTRYATVNGFGAAQYASYALTDTIALNARAEIWRDDNGFFVAAFRGVHDFVNAQYGFPAPGVVTAQPTTYSEFTLGVTFKPTIPYVTNFMLRPEIRYDYALTDTRPFNGTKNAPNPTSGRDRGVFTVGADFIIGF